MVELLVVIGIIAILIGILLPSLSAARSAANRVKCETALSQIGQAFLLYINDSNQYVPPTLFRTAQGPYGIGDDTIPVNSNIYWFNFLSPYANAANMGLATSNGGAAAQSRKRNVLWGCPAFTGYVRFSLATGDDINRTQPGYGMTAWLLFQGDSDATYDPIGGAVGGNETGKDQNILTLDANGKFTDPVNMRWFKIAEVRDSANRGLVSDCRFWLWESLSPGAGPSFPQNIAQQNASGASFTWTGSNQTTVDIFRHGKEPGASGTGSSARYDFAGGKIGYNVLYFDGHVATMATGDEAYRAQRLRFPN